tara:strand:+ start:1228 stop:1824 length:597 start_codon:yes stop_codon:yes gene_type:complete
MKKNKYIGVCGNIASGKSTIVSLFDKQKSNIVYENFRGILFLESFYQNPDKYSFETELSFLLQHYFFIKKAIKKYSFSIFDFSIILDRAYAEVTLSQKRKKLFQLVADDLEQEIGLPEKIIFLYCPEEILINRIKNRNREIEKSISIDYLTVLNQSIENQINLVKDKIEVVRIDSNQIDFATNKEGKSLVKSMVFRRG